jgi:hypothetical protein
MVGAGGIERTGTMSAFEIVTITVSVVAIALAATTYFRVSRVLQELGKGGMSWYRGSDADIENAPNEDERDAPIPKRPLRGRPE